jgi:hypothetical protein
MNDRVLLTTEQAIAMLPDDVVVHVFSMHMTDAEWSRDAVVDMINNGICELAGPHAESLGHKLAVQSGDKIWFVQTKE